MIGSYTVELSEETAFNKGSTVCHHCTETFKTSVHPVGVSYSKHVYIFKAFTILQMFAILLKMSDFLIYFFLLSNWNLDANWYKTAGAGWVNIKTGSLLNWLTEFLQSTYSCSMNNKNGKNVCFCEFLINTPQGSSNFKENFSELKWLCLESDTLKINVPAFSVYSLNHCPFVLSSVTWPTVARLRLKDYNASILVFSET